MRKLATIRKIDSIGPIEGADAIEVAQVGGWKIVTKKNEFRVGDLAVYFEIDSWIPDHLAPFLSKGHAPRVFNGVEGERLRTVKLRGQVSQGLLLDRTVALDKVGEIFEGMDVSELLNIQKYEPTVSAQLAGQVSGGFPSFIPKTDQERIQNLSREFKEWKDTDLTWEQTEKLDGSSMTVFFKDGKFGVCSRNWELREAEGNTLWAVAREYGLEKILSDHTATDLTNIALQGELIGPGIQDNKYKLTKHAFYIFDIYNIDRKQYLSPGLRKDFIERHGLRHVPVFSSAMKLYPDLTMDALLKEAEGKSVMGDITGPEREGHVYKCNELPVSFKCISNRFLLKEK